MISERHFQACANEFLRYQVLDSMTRPTDLPFIGPQPVKKLIGYGPTRSAAWRMAGMKPEPGSEPVVIKPSMPVEGSARNGSYTEAVEILKSMPIDGSRTFPEDRRSSVVMAAKRNGIGITTKTNGDGNFTVTRTN